MIEIRKAIETDSKNLLKLIKNINEKEQMYLRYDQESRSLNARLIKNIKEDHVVVFTDSNEIFGFIEYTIKGQLIWVYSLYFIKEYRYKTYDVLIPVFVGMKKSYKLPIHFAVHPDNYAMSLLTKFIRADKVCVYMDGRIEYRVKEVH